MIDIYYLKRASDGTFRYSYANDIDFVPYRGGGVDVAVVQGPSRVIQDVSLILLTPKGNLPYPNFGSFALTSGAVRFLGTTTLNDIQESTIQAVTYVTAHETSTKINELISELTTLKVEYSDSTAVVTLNLKLKSAETAAVGVTA